MYSKQGKPARSSGDSDTFSTNQFAPPRFKIPPTAELTAKPKQTPDVQAQPLGEKQQSNYPINIDTFTRNVPLPPGPRVQMKLNLGQNRVGGDDLQKINTSQIQLVQRQDDPPTAVAPVITQFDTWLECYAVMDATAKKGYDQFVTLQGEAKAIPVRENACKDRTSGKYDQGKAEAIWSKKAMTNEKFAEEFAKKEKADVDSIIARLTQIEHLCDETDGTNRPGSVGDGTSEWALLWESANGEPFRSPAGHAYKLRDYCKVIKEGIAEIQAKQGAVKDEPTKTRIAATLIRATDRYEKMKAALIVWNDRVSKYPTKWNPNGTSNVTPPGVDPEAKNQLQAGWPKDAAVTVP